MGKMLDALLRRNFNTTKFKNLLKHALSRLVIFENQHRARCSIARSDVVQLLQLGYQDEALLRVEYVIEEQNMFDAFVMIKEYCLLLRERVALLQNKECPEELKEAISSLMYAASRCGEFPELQHMREIFTSNFGIEFAASAVSSRRVNPKIVQKLSKRHASLESRLNVLTQIATETRITLHLQNDTHNNTLDIKDVNRKEKQRQQPESENKYSRIAAVDQVAIESAAHTEKASGAAWELSQSESQDKGFDNRSISNHQKLISSSDDGENTDDTGPSNYRQNFDGVYPLVLSSSESEDESLADSMSEAEEENLVDNYTNHAAQLRPITEKAVHLNCSSAFERAGEKNFESNSDTNGEIAAVHLNPEEKQRQLSEDVLPNESPDRIRRGGSLPWIQHNYLASRKNLRSPTKEFQDAHLDAAAGKEEFHPQSPKRISLKSPQHVVQTEISRLNISNSSNRVKHLPSDSSKGGRKAVSVRTRRTRNC